MSVPAYRVFYKRTINLDGGNTWFSIISGRTPLRSSENNNSDYNNKRSNKGGVKVNTETGASTDHIYKAASRSSSMVGKNKTMEYTVAVLANNTTVQDGHKGVSIELERY